MNTAGSTASKRVTISLTGQDLRDLAVLRGAPGYLSEQLPSHPSESSTIRALMHEGLRVVQERREAELYAEMADETRSERKAMRSRDDRRSRDTTVD
ncbi:hypothetical protein [Zhihengliuella salsuginis]|uniref:CopG family transcriptional regulator n=1 Tax=Zhihengliuella salsuginis TaxID=578222 RepID=A0ABQ3GHH6_9MICC|nr:hypothetical protein [Zhihengliuella salsuginis]GHD04204.1 hypothetical protein GCM10008096_11240 [Zhihengliuella salsuginis]